MKSFDATHWRNSADDLKSGISAADLKEIISTLLNQVPETTPFEVAYLSILNWSWTAIERATGHQDLQAEIGRSTARGTAQLHVGNRYWPPNKKLPRVVDSDAPNTIIVVIGKRQPDKKVNGNEPSAKVIENATRFLIRRKKRTASHSSLCRTIPEVQRQYWIPKPWRVIKSVV